jgi:hypothetical protein
MSLKIVLIRHGRSAQRIGIPIPGRHFREWQRLYDELGIDPDARPPASTVEAAREVRIRNLAAA